MKLKVHAALVYDFEPDTDAIVSVQAAHSDDQAILEEKLFLPEGLRRVQDPADERGERRFRCRFSGETSIRYEAIVDNGRRQALHSGLRAHDWLELPAPALQYLTASRFCPSDLFGRFAAREFGAHEGSDKVLAVLDWIYTHVDYVPGVSNAETTAQRTFVDRAGVCRDFSHLGITLCRALNIPARAVSAYALNLEPPDFHAVFEVYLAGGWWLVDPTQLAEPKGLVRIGVGRDAADIAFLSTSRPCTSLSQDVRVERVD